MLSLPYRTFLLLEGSLASVGDLGWRLSPALNLDHRASGPIAELNAGVRSRADPGGPDVREPIPPNEILRESPNLIWPSDRRWLVASEIDLDSTFVGGSTELIETLLADRRFEAWRASPDDQIAAGSDVVNMA